MSENATRLGESGEFPAPAKLLAGKKLANGWVVGELINRPPTATGGTFSASYEIDSTRGERGFLKAMDYTAALQSADPARALQAMTEAYNFERNILEKCKSKQLSRVVRVLDAGTIPSENGNPAGVVQYLIFELADRDVRSHVNRVMGDFDRAWALRTAHHVAAALRQLHSIGVAHQDIKPSNILVFEGRHSKLADLGRSSDRGSASPHDQLDCAGDRTYAPPELLYGHAPTDWVTRRLACDLYLLGSIVTYFFAEVSMTHALMQRLEKSHRPSEWGGAYEEVTPFIYHAFQGIIREFRKEFTFDRAGDVCDAIQQLCNPDPERRGHPENPARGAGKYSLERYVSRFDFLAKRAEYSLKRSVVKDGR